MVNGQSEREKAWFFLGENYPPINRCCLVADWNLYKTKNI